MSRILRRRLFVQGIVQGVGFRPWVHQLATSSGLTGFVLNSTLGVTIELEGPAEAQDRFSERFRDNLPPLAAVDSIRETALEPLGSAVFEIRLSEAATGEFVLIPPDIATCDDCIADFRDPSNRRYLYPFTNCTNCGPRYSIIGDIPYDRRNTTMSEFPLCAACSAEYHDPANRRFHAEPNACPDCGPSLELWTDGERVAVRAEAMARVRSLLAAGELVALKGLGGFHLACLASNGDAVRRLRDRKRRSDKPFAVMVRDIAVAERIAALTPEDRAALTSPRKPILLVERRPGTTGLAGEIAPGLEQVGLMLPYTPLHHLLFDGAPYDALVMTSGNLSEEPIACRNEDSHGILRPLASHFLLHNRDIRIRVDDSVVRTFESRERTLRRSRGFAPLPLDLGRPVRPVLACGGELKNTLCLTKDHYAVLSQHIGDLENLETFRVFEETLGHMKRFFRIEPELVAHDLHPGYLSTQYALSLPLPRIGVQHHHAHVASVMAEHHLDGEVIGIALDGTGYGLDGKIWGGEFFAGGLDGFERAYHFRYIPLAGGDQAVREPWRCALAYLRDAGVDPSFLADRVPPAAFAVVERMLERRLNTVDTSSCGRLFDAVAAILGIRREVNYEGQAAMQLEAAAQRGGTGESPYPFDFDGGIIDLRTTIRALAADRENVATAARRFHITIATVILEAALRMRRTYGLTRVCLSGGSFQNFRLLGLVAPMLRSAGFEVYLNALVPPNDGGLSLGQAAIACASS